MRTQVKMKFTQVLLVMLAIYVVTDGCRGFARLGGRIATSSIGRYGKRFGKGVMKISKSLGENPVVGNVVGGVVDGAVRGGMEAKLTEETRALEKKLLKAKLKEIEKRLDALGD